MSAQEDTLYAPRVLTVDQWRKQGGPNYTEVYRWRQQKLLWLAEDEDRLAGALEYYSQEEHAVEFICHWCDTFDPRLAFDKDAAGTRLPFVFFKRQAECFEFFLSCLRDEANGLVDKSRDMGVTWDAVSVSVWLWRFRPGAAIGWGSRKEELVDRIGDPKSIFEKIRYMVKSMPRMFWPKGFAMDEHATFMKLINPENDASIAGEAGDNIGRGGRTLVYFKDESAHYQHAEAIEAALMENTRVQIDISTQNGVGTVYDRKKDSGHEWTPGSTIEPGVIRVFTFDWSDHPEKTEEWHRVREKEARDAGLLHLFRQEVDRDAASSLQGIIIKPEWIRAAVDAHIHLKFGDNGGWCAGFDPFDEGGDLHAFSMRKGVVLRYVDDWGDGDTGEATRHVIGLIDQRRPIAVQYDCVGIGAGVKSEANRLVKEKKMPQGISFFPWDAGQGPLNPEEFLISGDRRSPLIKDFFANLKAQGWWSLARRFENTYRMRTEKDFKCDVGKLISLDSTLPKLKQLMKELSQPVMKKSGDLRLLVDKKPEGARSPNMADSVMMDYFPVASAMTISSEVLARSMQRGMRR